jgi:serine/threonine protein kinase
MRYVHSRGFLHLDLTPNNILLSQDFRAKICDFGLSRPVNQQGPRTGRSGTEAYAAPEQLGLEFDRTTKTDVFPFGLVLYEMIGRMLVFGDNFSLEHVVKRIRARQPPNIPDAFGALMQRLIPQCWSERPELRPSFAEIFKMFESVGFAILPNADRSEIRRAVSTVIMWE